MKNMGFLMNFTSSKMSHSRKTATQYSKWYRPLVNLPRNKKQIKDKNCLSTFIQVDV